MKEGYHNALKKLNLFFFRTQSLLMAKVLKKKWPGTSDQSFFRLQNKSRKIPLSVIYYLTKFDDIIKSGFWVIPKITSANLCKPIHDIINYSISICSFESKKCGKEGKKLYLIYLDYTEFLESEKRFFHEIKNIFYSFWKAIIWWKEKNLIKNSGHKL